MLLVTKHNRRKELKVIKWIEHFLLLSCDTVPLLWWDRIHINIKGFRGGITGSNKWGATASRKGTESTEFLIANQYLGLLQNSTDSQLLTFRSQLILFGITSTTREMEGGEKLQNTDISVTEKGQTTVLRPPSPSEPHKFIPPLQSFALSLKKVVTAVLHLNRYSSFQLLMKAIFICTLNMTAIK